MKKEIFSKLSAWGFMVIALALVTSAYGASGDLDTSFGGTGTKRLGFGGGYDQANAVAVQADGKLVMAGFSQKTYNSGSPQFSLVRLDTNNILDATFGNGGKVLTPVGLSGLPYTDARANAVKIQVDGKIVAAGYAHIGTNYPTFTVVRYNPDGSIDTGFGTNGTGIAYTDFGQPSTIRAMVIQGDGRIVVAGYTNYSANAGEGAVALARYETNGVLDVSFGTGGRQITTGVTGYSGANGMMIQFDGKIVAVGIGIGSGHNGIDFALYRYTTNGVLDTTFGGGTGKVFTQISTNNNGYFDSANAVATQFGNDTIQNPDKIVVAGFYQSDYPYHFDFALARYTLDGTLDTTFGNGGIVRNPITSGSVIDDGDTATSLVVQGLGIQARKITVGGYSRVNGTTYFTLARYNAAGAFDTTFGTNGTGTITIPIIPSDYPAANAMALQSGKFVLAGYSGFYDHNYDFTAARFNSDGSPDTNFGNGGVLAVDVFDLDSKAQGVASQADGKTIVAGSANNSTNDVFALARFNLNGSLDTSFGSGGKLLAVVGTNGSVANAVQLQSDGKIVAAGTANSGSSYAVVRYNANGSLDNSFGIAGKAISPGGSANAVAIQPDGKIVVAGNSSGSTTHYGVARYTTNGALDTSFGGTGIVTTSIGSGGDTATSAKVQTDGKIVVCGYSILASTADISLARYNTNGALDLSFGSFGRVTTDFGSGNSGYAFGLAIQPDGKFVVAGGVVISGGSIYFALLRYTTNGVLDNTFGSGGEVITQVQFDAAYATAVALQPDGRIIAAGLSKIGTNNQFAVVRYNPDGSPDTSFGAGGQAIINFDDGADNTGNAVALDAIGRVIIAGDAGSLFGVARLQADPFLKILSITPLGNGTNLLTGLGVPGSGHTMNAAATLGAGSFAPLGPVAVDALGQWQYEDILPNPLTNRFYRLSFP